MYSVLMILFKDLIMFCCSLIAPVVLALGGIIYFVGRRRVSPKMNLEVAHVIITGGSSGIGLSLAKLLASRCAKLTIIARDKKKLADAETALSGKKAQVLTISCDLSGDYTAVEVAIEQAVDKHGPIGVLLNCAGSSVAKEFELSDPKIIENMMRVNYYSSAFVTRAALPKMLAADQGGIVVFTSSQAGQVGIYGFGPYAASKFALRGLAESLAMELAPRNISVSMVFPPDTDTPGYALEQLGKPLATHKISQTSGLFSADQVAASVVPQILAGKFFCSVGLDGWMLATLTAGMAPPSGVLESVTETCLGGVFRFVSLFYNWWFNKIARDTLKAA